MSTLSTYFLSLARPSVAGRVASRPGSGRYGACKGATDVVAALLLLIPAAPLILLLMVLVKLTSEGPALYSQVRLGLGGRPFRIYKIRTMSFDCERTSGPKWSTKGDPRVTRLGNVLRLTHLDELPQLWNVLRGDMALVGPRPERPEFVTELERTIPDYRERLQVLPGVTGLAQIQLPADSDLEGVRLKVRYDLCYIDRMGPWLDLRIIGGTALKVAGVPFKVTGRLLALPQASVETQGFQALVA